MYEKMTLRFLGSGITTGFSLGTVMWFMGGTFYFMSWLIKEGHTNFEDSLSSFMGLVYGAMLSASAVGVTGDIGKAKVAAHDMFKLLDRASQIDGLNPTGTTPKLGNDGQHDVGRIEFKGVQFYYPFRPDVKVLQGMTFTIESGTSVGVAGPSGGGKSTLMAMIQRFYDPQEGTLYIGSAANRLDLSAVNIRWWRNQVGSVGQEPILFAGSVLDNVRYGMESVSVSDDYLEKCKQDACLTFLDDAGSKGWQTEVGSRGGRLSGGQKQRVAICRALMRDPKIILLDEATSALDSASEAVVNKALENARFGRTSFAIAHRLSTIQSCDVIIVVADGKIAEQGSHEQLMAQEGVYHKLQQSQAK
jgi:ATP-binding cassette subfamily B (MDR/TAP) protein 1